MKKETFRTVLSAALTILSVLPAGAMPRVYGWMFISFSVATSLFLYRRASFAPIAGCLTGMLAMLALSIHMAGSVPAFGRDLLALFAPDQAREEYVHAGEASEQNREIIQRDAAQVDRLTEIAGHLLEMQDQTDRLWDSIRESHFWNGEAAPKEVALILPIIKEEYEKNAAFLPQVWTEREQAEVFYKMRLSRLNYRYASILRAMEAFGIPCGAMSIDGYTLMEWDTEVVFAKYSMIHSLEADAAADVTYEEAKCYYYDDYRMKGRNENSDVFDYGTWRYIGKASARESQRELIERMMDHYSKWYINFSGN